MPQSSENETGLHDGRKEPLEQRYFSMGLSHFWLVNGREMDKIVLTSGLFYLLYCRTKIRKFSICFQGPKFFNSLSPEIQNATSIVSFTLKLKAFLLT